MNELPAVVRNSGLWARLSEVAPLAHHLTELRAIAEAIGAKVSETIPEFTDHSVLHMDSLWAVTDQIFTSTEIQRFSVGEAFVLGCAFYVHDLGMALGATAQGREQLQASSAYQNCFSRLVESGEIQDDEAHVIALRVAARELHAKAAEALASEVLPGLDRYLIENTDTRQAWGDYIGKVAESHHWSLNEVEARLGIRGSVPDPIGGKLDLGFLACALRIIDYAHINSGRAAILARVLRARINNDSIKHWYAQERISGPIREAGLLVYASMRPIQDVDAWWIFYEMASGLDQEIITVADYLRRRSVSIARFSLEGVKGIRTPNAFAELVVPKGFEPVDIRFRSSTVDRVVELLGGRTLYGEDRFAPIRELLQNACDAIHLRTTLASASDEPFLPGEVEIRLNEDNGAAQLVVSDNGVGMTEKVATTYLLGIASDFWHSPEFYAEYETARAAGFRPVGRFGIGFLSVFMLGDAVEVQTQRLGSERYSLVLRGIGRRGSLTLQRTTHYPSTTISVFLKEGLVTKLSPLFPIVQNKAPMVDVRLKVIETDSTIATLEPSWWKLATQQELLSFVNNWQITSYADDEDRKEHNGFHDFDLFADPATSPVEFYNTWPGSSPEICEDSLRVLAVPDYGRVLLCSNGFAVTATTMGGISGLVDVGDVTLNAARSMPIGFDESALHKSLLKKIYPAVLSATNALVEEAAIPSRFQFLWKLAEHYGICILVETKLPWISVIVAPGATELIAPTDFVARMQSATSACIGYAVSPWQIDTAARTHLGQIEKKPLLVPVPEVSGMFHHFGEQIRKGTLPELFATPYDPDHTTHLERAYPLMAVLTLVAEAWNVQLEQLYSGDWLRNQNEVVGQVKRTVG